MKLQSVRRVSGRLNNAAGHTAIKSLAIRIGSAFRNRSSAIARLGLALLILVTLSFETHAQASWVPQTSGVTNNLRSVHFINANEGWAVGLGGAVLHTTNGGDNWSSLPGLTDNLLAVRFTDSNVGWTNSGTMIHRSTNGGAAWAHNVVHGSSFRNSIFSVSANQAWSPVVGTGLENGLRWFTRYTFNGSSIVAQDFNVISSGASPLDIYFIDPDNGWSVGTSGTITRISNATSASPSFSFQLSNTSQSLNAIHMVDATNGWIVGNNGTILRTTNGGATWTPQTTGVPAVNFFDVFFDADLLHGWAVGAGGTIIATINGGISWSAETSNVTAELRSVFFVVAHGANTLGFAVGANGTILKRNAPTEAALTAFTANHYEDVDALIEWQTGYEVDNLGFNIYRDEGQKRIRLNRDLVAGSALVAGPRTFLTAGRSYAWRDKLLKGQPAQYWLEEIDLSGSSSWHGPISLQYSPGKIPSRSQSEFLHKLESRQSNAQAGSLSQVKRSAILPRAGLANPAAALPAVKILIKQEGWYRIPQQQLLAAGLGPSVDPRYLHLLADGIEIPIKVTGESDGRLDSQDAVEFYGVGLDTPSTDARAYWLIEGSQLGQRVAVLWGKPGQTASNGFPYTVERKERTVYFSALRNGESENFFGAVIASQPVDQALVVQHLNRASGAPAALEVALRGVTYSNHNVKVQLNGQEIGEAIFLGQSTSTMTIPVSEPLLREGENQVRLIATGGASDVSLVDYIRIKYSHSYAADGNALRFTAAGGQTVSVKGFTSENIRLIDVTNQDAPQEIGAAVLPDKGSFQITASIPGSGQRILLAFSGEQVKQAAAVTFNQPSNWRQNRAGADLIIISVRSLFSSLDRLISLRQSQGLSVAVVDIEDIYDEFSFGHKSLQALKEFIATCSANWRKPPRFLLLAGDASFDPRNYLGFGDSDLVPTRLIDTQYMETASDDWFVDFDDDGLPEVAVGRLPVRNAGEASTLITKIIDYDESAPSDTLLLVSDANEGFDFERANTALRASVPQYLEVEEIQRGRLDAATARSRLLETINRGQKIINYFGHGSVDIWNGNLLTSYDAALLTNSQKLSLFVMMTCLNGYFQDPLTDGLSESLLKSGEGGAVAAWSSSGMCDPSQQGILNREFFRLILSGGDGDGVTVGQAASMAKAAVNDLDVRRTWVLLGDPTTRLR